MSSFSDILSPINFTTFSPDLPDFRARSASITLNPIDQNRSPSPTESIKSHQIEEATTTAYQKNTVWISDLSSEIGDTQLATSTTATRRRTTRQSVQESHSAVGFSTPTTKLLAELYRMPVFGKDGDKNLSRSLSPVAGVCPNSPPKVTVRSKKRPSGGDKNMDEFGKPPSRCKRKKSTTVTDEQRVASPKRKGTGSKLQGEEKERMRREKEEEKERKRFLGEEEKERRKREKVNPATS